MEKDFILIINYKKCLEKHTIDGDSPVKLKIINNCVK